MPSELDNREEILFVIEWAKIALFRIVPNSAKPATPWGRPDPDKPIFMGVDANKVRIGQAFEVSERRPSGWKFPIPRHLSTGHTIGIDRLWIVKPQEGEDPPKGDYVITPNQLMCMSVTWQEAVNGKGDADATWFQRIYYGVTGPVWNLDSSVEEVAFTGEQAFTAMFFKRKSGKGAPPVIG